MKIGVLGSGNVGTALARGFKETGQDVRIASREGNKLAAFTKETGIAEGRFTDVAAFAEVVVIAVKGDIAVELAKSLAAGQGPIDVPRLVQHDDDVLSQQFEAEEGSEEHRRRSTVGTVGDVEPDADAQRRPHSPFLGPGTL
jgi:predicted dinucleotide-binding enzyme